MFWYLPPLKTCKLVPISLNHIWLGAKQFPHRVHPKKRLALEFERHCHSNYWLEFEPHCQSTGTGVRARTGPRASAPDVSAPLRARTGTRECPGPAPLRACGTRQPVPTAPLQVFTHGGHKGGPGPSSPKQTVCVRSVWACGSPQAWRLASRWRWCAAPLRARTGLRECPSTQHKHCLPCVCDVVCPQFDTSLLGITAGMVAGLSRQRLVGAGSDDFAAYALRRAAQPKTKRARTDGQEAHDVSLARDGRLGEAAADAVAVADGARPLSSGEREGLWSPRTSIWRTQSITHVTVILNFGVNKFISGVNMYNLGVKAQPRCEPSNTCCPNNLV